MTSQQATATRTRRGAPVIVDVEEAEAALVENYPHLVRLAYLILPAGLGRHRRVMNAHTLVQRALPRSASEPDPASLGVPGPRGPVDRSYALMRQEVLCAALAFEQEEGARGWLRKVATGVLPPHVWGLRLHPKAGGTDEAALDRALAGLDAPARAAYALLELENLRRSDGREVRKLLAAADAPDPRAALKSAEAVPYGLLGAGGFDPCTVQARPTDLLRRRQHGRAGLIAGAAVAVTAVLVAVLGGGPEPYSAGGPPNAYGAGFLDPAQLVRVDNTAWKRASRVDFTVWPTRGGRAKDAGLLGRALQVWAHPGERVAVSATKGTTEGLPAQPPQLLYAGDVDAATVVLMYDGLRLVRYAEPRDGKGEAALDFTRVDGADASTAAVVLGRIDGNTRFLTAPWVTGSASRDLLGPGRPAQKLGRTADGVTDPVRMPGAASDTSSAGADGPCGTSWPALEFQAAKGVGPDKPFLLTDLGDLVPVHLTYQAADSAAPAEAAGKDALASWARTACHLGSMRGMGVRTVNTWQYAEQRLPEDNGRAAWLCTRADTWTGTNGRTLALFLPPVAEPTSPGAPVGQSTKDTGACGRSVPQVLAGVLWKSTAGHWYLLAAGSPDVARINATGGVTGSAEGPTMAVRAEQGARAELSAVLDSGTGITTLR
ncbi:hypothetical protein ACFYXS_24420 [Streptomyces sp. NPDC002574]|uniref:hypothetical protein n=1 Tax=Streptomyces sp. NPDC002574 TaxID=3364652 RepID=UPI0036AE6EC2